MAACPQPPAATPLPLSVRVAIVAASLITLGLIYLHWLGWMPWQITVLVGIAWLPAGLLRVRDIARYAPWLAVFFVLVVAQGAHMIEHIAQMVQLHLLGWSRMQAHGLIGMLDVEWVHFIFDVLIIPPFVILLLTHFWRNPWLWLLLPLVSWHAAEHVVIMHTYLTTGIVGSPGLLAQGGLIDGGTPLIRPDLHFLYNLAEIVLILVAYRSQRRHMPVPGFVAAASPSSAEIVTTPTL